jgi:hypothetical protein
VIQLSAAELSADRDRPVGHAPSLDIHSAGGNKSRTTRRRAVSLRCLGTDTRYDDRPGTFLQSVKLRNALPPITLKAGDPVVGELFPVFWPRTSQEA